jgi:hypothetical protein
MSNTAPEGTGLAPDEYLGMALGYASAALEWVQQPAVYALFLTWLRDNPDTGPLTRRQLRAAEILVTAMSARAFGMTEADLRAGLNGEARHGQQ